MVKEGEGEGEGAEEGGGDGLVEEVLFIKGTSASINSPLNGSD